MTEHNTVDIGYCVEDGSVLMENRHQIGNDASVIGDIRRPDLPFVFAFVINEFL